MSCILKTESAILFIVPGMCLMITVKLLCKAVKNNFLCRIYGLGYINDFPYHVNVIASTNNLRVIYTMGEGCLLEAVMWLLLVNQPSSIAAGSTGVCI